MDESAPVPYENEAVRAWLKEQGFHEGDLRSGVRVSGRTGKTPLMEACFQGEVSVCKWLHDHGADILKADNYGVTPMSIACLEGHLSVCKWLFEVSGAATITAADKADNRGFTTMHDACRNGHLSVCKWLFEVGMAALVTKKSRFGYTPMYFACQGGHLSVCKWLFEEGAAADISESYAPLNPMLQACYNDHLPVCKWLVFSGALNRRPEDGDCVPMPFPEHDVGAPLTAAIGHVDQAIVARDTQPAVTYKFPCVDDSDDDDEPPCDHRPALLTWAQDAVATHRTFFHVVLRASVVLPDSHPHAKPDQRCHLPRLPRVVLERLATMLGVEMGRRLRNVREFAEALAAEQEEQRSRNIEHIERRRWWSWSSWSWEREGTIDLT